MAKETLLNWTKFEKALDTMDIQRDLLEFYHLVKANVGTTVGTIEFEDNPMVYVSLDDLNEDIGDLEGSGITHSYAVHKQLKKHGLLKSRQVDDDDWVQPSRELIFNLGRLGEAIKELDEDNLQTEFYNELVIAVKDKKIPVHQADFNGHSEVIRINELYNAGIEIPLSIFAKYTERCEIPVVEPEPKEETAEEKTAQLEKRIEQMRKQATFLQQPETEEEIQVCYKGAIRYGEVMEKPSKRKTYTPTDKEPNPKYRGSGYFFGQGHQTPAHQKRAEKVEVRKIERDRKVKDLEDLRKAFPYIDAAQEILDRYVTVMERFR